MAENQRWYKGNLHMHSFWSDGVGFPEVGARWFKERGYQFIAFTEHDQHQTGEHWVSVGDLQERGKEFQEIPTLRLYKELFCDSWVEVREDSLGQQVCLKPLYEYRHLLEEPEKFLILNGEEISVSSPQSPHWINVINAPVVILPQKSPESVADAVEQTIKAVEHGSQDSGRPVLVYFNHPNFLWNATAEELAAARSLRFVEIHTALEDCHTYGDEQHVGTERIWDILLTLRLRQNGDLVYGLATDDCHAGYHLPSEAPVPGGHFFAHPGRAWIMVRANRLTPESILHSILDGEFYASTGVSLKSIKVQADSLQLEIEPEDGAHYTTQFIGTLRGVSLQSAPVLDGEGNPLRTTQKYSAEVGKVLAEETGLHPSYRFRGDELYVRAYVISDRFHPRPTVPGDVMKAWTQPFRRI